jgi:hypothetical protein
MEIRALENDLIHANREREKERERERERQTDRQEKLIVAFDNIINSPKCAKNT